MNELPQSSAQPVEEIQHGQPKALYLLFFAEMWERFSFYGMKALLLAYMVTQLKFDEPKGYAILGAYAGLVYTMPLFGGYFADKFLGYRRAIIFGGILMSVGHFVLAVPEDWSFFYGLAFIIVGNGFFKPNISSLVGTLYATNDPRRDSGFSLFYMGINVGAALGGFLCAYVAETTGNWHYGFGLAGILMVVGLIVFYAGRNLLGNRGLKPDNESNEKGRGITADLVIYVGAIAAVPLLAALFNRHTLIDWLLYGLGSASLIYILITAVTLDAVARKKVYAALVLIIFSTLFWAFYEQNAGSLNLFAMRNVNMNLLGAKLPALAINNFLPPGWVIVLSFFFAWLWPWLHARGKEPSTPFKFALSFLLLGIGFYVFYLACKASAGTGLIPLYAFVLGYFFIICGEMCISPIGLSMVTKLSPLKMVGLMMGFWFFASAIGEFLAGKIGALMSVPEAVQNNAVQSLPYYANILSQIGLAAFLSGVLLILLIPILRKWMGGIH